jgi:predicted DNA-binding transcriptional regulator AlpA
VTRATPKLPLVEREVWNGREAASAIGIAAGRWYELNRDGMVPRSIVIGGALRWRRRELMAWLEAGCPESSAWTWRPRSLETRVEDLENQLAALRSRIEESRMLSTGQAMELERRGLRMRSRVVAGETRDGRVAAGKVNREDAETHFDMATQPAVVVDILDGAGTVVASGRVEAHDEARAQQLAYANLMAGTRPESAGAPAASARTPAPGSLEGKLAAAEAERDRLRAELRTRDGSAEGAD